MDANVVFSVGKTASTSMFVSWAKTLTSFPVFHTHDLEWFCVVDREGSEYVKYLTKTHGKHLYEFRKPYYIDEDGYTEFRFQLTPEFTIGDAIPHDIFSRTRFVGMFRDPKKRRISQFMDNLTTESINAFIDASKLDVPHITKENAVSVLSRIDDLKVKRHRMLKFLTNVAKTEGRLLGGKELVEMFRTFFCHCEMNEYMWYDNLLESITHLTIDPSSLAKKGFHYSSFNNLKLLALKMEDMGTAAVAREITEFTGVRQVCHERNIEKESFAVSGCSRDIKKCLLDDTTPIYPKVSGEEKMISAMGYKST